MSRESEPLRARRSEIAGLSALVFGPEDAPVELVFLHANGFHAALYAELLTPLAVGRRLVAPDLRGYGRTTLPADPEGLTSWRVFSDDVRRLLDALGAGPVVLAGHSLGGTTALLAAADAPEAARALVLIEPVIPPPPFGSGGDSPPVEEQTKMLARGALGRRRRFASRADVMAAYRGRGGFRTWPDAALAAYVEEGFADAADAAEGGEGVVLRCAPEWEAAVYLARGDDLWAALEAVRAPLTVRAGSVHSTFPPESQERLAALRPDADVARVEGASHFLPLERPDVARSALASALVRRPADSGPSAA